MHTDALTKKIRELEERIAELERKVKNGCQYEQIIWDNNQEAQAEIDRLKAENDRLKTQLDVANRECSHLKKQHEESNDVKHVRAQYWRIRDRLTQIRDIANGEL